MRLKNQQGFSIVQALVAAQIFGIVVYVLLESTGYMKLKTKETDQQLQMNDMVYSLFNEIRSNLHLYQFAEQEPDPEDIDLPMAWGSRGFKVRNMTDLDDSEYVPVSECDNRCPPGRLGYYVVTVNNYRGMFKLVIVLENRIMFDGKKIYTFLVRGN